MVSILGSPPGAPFISSIFKEANEDRAQTASCSLGRDCSAFAPFGRFGANHAWNCCATPRTTIAHSAPLPCRSSTGNTDFLPNSSQNAGQDREATCGAMSDLLQQFVTLLEAPCGSGQATAKAGNEVLSQLNQATSKLQGAADQQVIFEILRVIKLLQMDMALVGAARKDATLNERLQNAKAHALQASQLMTVL